MFGTILKKTFWNTFDHLGTLILLNLAWFFVSVPWLLGGFFAVRVLAGMLGVAGLVAGAAAWILSVWLNPASLWILSVASDWADYRSLSRGEMWGLLRARLFTGLWLSIAAFAVALILGVNGAFYLSLSDGFHWIGLLLAGVTIWALVALMSLSYHLGLILARDRSVGVRNASRQALYVSLAMPVTSFFLGVGTLIGAVLLVITQVGLPLVAMAFPAIFAATGERELFKRLLPPDERDPAADRAEEARTFRDLIKPWDMDR
jgi:hypothetical protein